MLPTGRDVAVAAREKKPLRNGFYTLYIYCRYRKTTTKPDEWQWLFILPHYSQWLYFGLITALSSCTRCVAGKSGNLVCQRGRAGRKGRRPFRAKRSIEPVVFFRFQYSVLYIQFNLFFFMERGGETERKKNTHNGRRNSLIYWPMRTLVLWSADLGEFIFVGCGCVLSITDLTFYYLFLLLLLLY